MAKGARRGWLRACLLIACAGCAAHVADGKGSPGPDPITDGDPPLAVTTIRLHAAGEPAVARLAAVTEPVRRTAVGSRLMARVAAVSARAGQRVKRGAVLARLEEEDLRARRRALSASASASGAQVHLASAELERAHALAVAGALAGSQLQAAAVSREIASASADGSSAALDELSVQLGEAIVRAPFDALVVQASTEQGSFSAPGQPLFVLEDDSELRIFAPLADRHVGALVSGREYPVVFATGQSTSAVLEAIVPSGDPRSPGLIARFIAPNQDHVLRSGVVAYVTIPTLDRAAPTFVVPSEAIVQRDGLAGVFTVKDGRAWLSWCAVDAASVSDKTRILSGVWENDVIVANAAVPGLQDARRVTVQP